MEKKDFEMINNTQTSVTCIRHLSNVQHHIYHYSQLNKKT